MTYVFVSILCTLCGFTAGRWSWKLGPIWPFTSRKLLAPKNPDYETPDGAPPYRTADKSQIDHAPQEFEEMTRALDFDLPKILGPQAIPAIKILKMPREIYKTDCNKCGCKFQYHRTHTRLIKHSTAYWVPCPNCETKPFISQAFNEQLYEYRPSGVNIRRQN